MSFPDHPSKYIWSLTSRDEGWSFRCLNLLAVKRGGGRGTARERRRHRRRYRTVTAGHRRRRLKAANQLPPARSFVRALDRSRRRSHAATRGFHTYMVVRTYLHVLLCSNALCTYVYGVLQHLLHSYTSTIPMGFGMNILNYHPVKSRKRNYRPPLPAHKCRHMSQR